MGSQQRYTATESEIRDAVEDLVAQRTGSADGHLLGFHLRPGSRFGVVARRTEVDCFSEAFGETAESLSLEFGPFEHLSGFFLVINSETGMPAGVARYVDGGVDANPTLRDLETINTMPEVTRHLRHLLESQPGSWDITTTGVLPAHRGHHGDYQVMGMLGRMMMLASEIYDVPGMSMVSSQQLLKTLTYVGFPVRLLSQTPLVYPDGLPFLPCWMDIRSASTTILRHLDKVRSAADNPLVAREIATLEPLILGAGTGAGFDEFIDMTPQ